MDLPENQANFEQRLVDTGRYYEDRYFGKNKKKFKAIDHMHSKMISSVQVYQNGFVIVLNLD